MALGTGWYLVCLPPTKLQRFKSSLKMQEEEKKVRQSKVSWLASVFPFSIDIFKLYSSFTKGLLKMTEMLIPWTFAAFKNWVVCYRTDCVVHCLSLLLGNQSRSEFRGGWLHTHCISDSQCLDKLIYLLLLNNKLDFFGCWEEKNPYVVVVLRAFVVLTFVTEERCGCNQYGQENCGDCNQAGGQEHEARHLDPSQQVPFCAGRITVWSPKIFVEISRSGPTYDHSGWLVYHHCLSVILVVQLTHFGARLL